MYTSCDFQFSDVKNSLLLNHIYFKGEIYLNSLLWLSQFGQLAYRMSANQPEE